MSQISILQCCTALVDDTEVQALIIGSKWSKFLLIVQLPTLQVIQKILLDEEYKKSDAYFVPYSFYTSYIIAYKNKQYVQMPLYDIQLKTEINFDNTADMQEEMKRGEYSVIPTRKMSLEKLRIENKKQREVRQQAVQLSTKLREKNVPNRLIKRVLNNERVQRQFYKNAKADPDTVDDVLEHVKHEPDDDPIVSHLQDPTPPFDSTPTSHNNPLHNNDPLQIESTPNDKEKERSEEENSEEERWLKEFTIQPEEALELFEQEQQEKEENVNKINDIDDINSPLDEKDVDVKEDVENVERKQELDENLVNDVGTEQNVDLDDKNDFQEEKLQNTGEENEKLSISHQNSQNDQENDNNETNDNIQSQLEKSQDDDKNNVNLTTENIQQQQDQEQEHENQLIDAQNDQKDENNEALEESKENEKEDLLFQKSPKQQKYTDEQQEEANKMIEELKQYVINEEDSDDLKVTQVRLKKGEEIKQMRRSFDQDDLYQNELAEQSDFLSDSSAQFVSIDDEGEKEKKKQTEKSRKKQKMKLLQHLKLPPKPDQQQSGKNQKRKKKKQITDENKENHLSQFAPDETLTQTTQLFEQNIMEPLERFRPKIKKQNFQIEKAEYIVEKSTRSSSYIESSTSYDSGYNQQNNNDDDENEPQVVKLETTRKNVGTIVKQSGNKMIDEIMEKENKNKIKLAQFLRSLEDKNLLKQRNIKYTKNSLEYKIYKQKLQYQKFKIKKSLSAPDIQLKFVAVPQSQLEFKQAFQSILPCNPIINMLYGRANLRAMQQIKELDLSQQFDVKFANLDLSPGKFLYGKFFIDLLDTTIKNDVLLNYNVEFMKLIIPAMQGIFEAGYGLTYAGDNQSVEQYEILENNTIDYDLDELNTQLKAQREIEKEFAFIDIFGPTQLYLEFLPLYINKFNILFRQHIPEVFINLIKQQIKDGKPVRINDLHTYPVCYVWAYYLKMVGVSIYHYFKQNIQPKKQSKNQQQITLQQICRGNQISSMRDFTQCLDIIDQTFENQSQKEQEQKMKMLQKLAQALPKQNKPHKKKQLNLQIVSPASKIFSTLKEQEYSFQDTSYKPNAHLYEISLFLNIFFNGFENKINSYIIRRSKDLLSSLNQHRIEASRDPMPSFNDIIISSLTQAEMLKQLEYSELIENQLKKEAFYPKQDVQQTLLVNNQCVSFTNTPGNYSVYIKPQKEFQDSANVHIVDILMTLGYKTDIEQPTQQFGLVDFSFLTLFIQFTLKNLDISVFYYNYIKQLVENDKFQPKQLFQLLTQLFLVNENDILKSFIALYQFEYMLLVNNNYYLALSRYSRHLQSSEQYFLQEFLDHNQKDCFITNKLKIVNERTNTEPVQYQQSIIKNSIQDIEIKDPKTTQENAYIMDQISAYTKQKPQLRVQNILSRKGTRNTKQTKLNPIAKTEKSNNYETQRAEVLSNNIDFFVENPFAEYKKQLALLCQDPDFWKQDDDDVQIL